MSPYDRQSGYIVDFTIYSLQCRNLLRAYRAHKIHLEEPTTSTYHEGMSKYVSIDECVSQFL